MGLLASWVGIFANIAQVILLVLGMFLILVVLLQRGRGGGLAGAFGGAGGQSAFGTKAGDVFTKITIGIAILWVITNGVNGMLIRASQSAISSSQLPSSDDKDGPVISTGEGATDIPEAPEAGSGTTGGASATEGDESETEAGESETTGETEGTAAGEADATSGTTEETTETEATTSEAAAETTDETPAPETTEESSPSSESGETPPPESTTDGAANPPN